MSSVPYESIRLIDVLRPGLRSHATLAFLDKSLVKLPYVRFSAKLEVPSDPDILEPWTKKPVGLEPGQPIAVKWEFNAGVVVDVGTAVTARIEFGSHVLYTSPSIPIKDSTTGVQHVDVVIDSPVVASLFYRFGSRELRLVVNGNGPRGGPYMSRTAWNVVPPSAFLPPPFSGYWFSWSGGPRRSSEWKQSYVVGGSFVNRSQYTAFQHAHVRLSEETLNWHEAYESENASAGEVDFSGPIAPGVAREHQFPIGAKDFYWCDGRPTWAATAGGHWKYYRYRAHVTLSDIYGNTYEDLWAQGPTVEVKVSAAKEAYSVTASASAIAAAALAVAAAFLQPWLAVAASAAYVAAEYAGRKALDPPEPDDDFLARVEIEIPQLPPAVPDFEVVGDFFREIVHIIAADNALTAIEGKLLGAQRAQSDEGIEVQSQRYEEVRGWIVERYQVLEQLLAPSIEVVRRSELAPDRLEEGLEASANGLTEEARQALVEVQVPTEVIDGLHETVTHPELRDDVQDLGLAELLGIQMQAMTFVVRHILSYQPSAIPESGGMGILDHRPR